ncbi:MAG: class C sortase, partial [bacterium]
PAENRQLMADAREYNLTFTNTSIRDVFTEAAQRSSPRYRGLLNPNGDGIMGVIEIPKIGVKLPIYHTTDDYGLTRGVGHMEGTSLPVGGKNTHCGLAGHRALPSARLFTDLDRLGRGDLIYITVLNELLVYQVDQISVVLPHELDYMAIVNGMDLVTLVTCTPYGVNSHRLLVRGRRVALENISAALALSDSVYDATLLEGAVVCAVPVAAVGLLFMALIRPKRRFRLKESMDRK